MIPVYPVLSQQMRENGTTYSELAAIADISVISVYLKMCGIKRWNLTEVVRICCFFRTPNAEHLFQKRNYRFVRYHYNTQNDKSQ